MILREYTYADDGSELSVREVSANVLYDNESINSGKTSTGSYTYNNQYSTIYKVLLDPREKERLSINFDRTVKAVVNNREFNLLSYSLIQYGGIDYLYKLEFGL